MRARLSKRLVRPPALVLTLVLGGLVAGLQAESDWPSWRGPDQNGVSKETGLPSAWSPQGENLAWRVPYGSRSAPVVFGRHVYLQNTAGRSTNWSEADDVQERVMCFDTESGKLLWEYKFNLALSDVPPHRVGWASPTVDPETGNVLVWGVGAQLMALSPEGKLLWQRSLVEDFGMITTHGGRTVNPVVEGNLVIVSALESAWGPWARGSNRFFAFDKRTGKTVWISTPQARHYDTNSSSGVVANIGDQRLLIVGGTDGAFHGIRVQTGEPVWKYEVSKRAINNSVLVDGTRVILTHSEENLDTNEMGQIAAIDGTATGNVTPPQIKWKQVGWQGGFSSPVMDGNVVFQLDNGAVLKGFDRETGHELWEKALGTLQKGSPVLADGKLYVGTENGRFYILKATSKGVDVLDEDLLGTAEAPEAIIASPAIANGRVYVASMTALYAIGPKASTAAAKPAARPAAASAAKPGAPASVAVFPVEATLKPGETLKFTARVFDATGNFIREEKATWAVEQLQGSVGADGGYVVPKDATPHIGSVKATVGGLTGTGYVRVLAPLPMKEDFERFTGEAPPPYWVNSTGKYVIKDVDGTKALMRVEDNTTTRRARLFMGTADMSNYTIEADVRSVERRRQLGDVGLFAQKYGLVLFGNAQRLELHPWQPATAMTVAAPFKWKADTWYRMKLRVASQPDGSTRVQGKVWPRGEAEPTGWMVEKLDKIGHRAGSPGVYSDAPFGAYYDNIIVTPNGQ